MFVSEWVCLLYLQSQIVIVCVCVNNVHSFYIIRKYDDEVCVWLSWLHANGYEWRGGSLPDVGMIACPLLLFNCCRLLLTFNYYPLCNLSNHHHLNFYSALLTNTRMIFHVQIWWHWTVFLFGTLYVVFSYLLKFCWRLSSIIMSICKLVYHP